MNVLLMKSNHLQQVLHPSPRTFNSTGRSAVILTFSTSLLPGFFPLEPTDRSGSTAARSSPCSAGWSGRRGRARPDAGNAQTSSAFRPSGLRSLKRQKHKLRLNDEASDIGSLCLRPLTSGDVQALHGQHPVVVARIVEPVLHHGIVGKLLQDFDGFVLPPGFVEG